MHAIIEVLKENPLLLLFVVAGIGYPLGQLKIGGARLGVAAVLFVGLAIGALDPDLKLPEVVYTLGLVLFVYCIGLSSGSIFFASLRQQGVRNNLLVLGGLVIAAAIAALAHLLLGIKATLTAGLFAGSLTNTPALAGVIEHIRAAAGANVVDQMVSEPVIAYSLSYPMGVLGMILSMYVLQRVWKIDYAAEAQNVREYGPMNDPLLSRTVQVTNDVDANVEELVHRLNVNVVFGRLKREDHVELVTGKTHLQPGDLVNMVGAEPDVNTVRDILGVDSEEHLEQDLSRYDKRRVFISSPQVVGRKLKDLHLVRKYGAIVTRLRRGDLEMLPHGDTALGMGDQVRVVAPRDQMDAVIKFFGDSYRSVSEIDVLTFSFGLALGLLLGMLPIPLPGGVTLKLGNAGGPLIVALVLGALGRSGPIVWQLPYSANLTLRQIGLIIFLAGIGTRSGYAFVSTLSQGGGLQVFAAGAALTVLVSLLTLFVGYKLMKMPMGLLLGIMAGLQTQPAVLGFAQEQTGNELPNIGYATVYPVAMIAKILLAQALLILFL